jgi:hypothetical protein
MRVLRILVAGLIAIAAMVAVMFAALVVFFTGLAAFVLQLFGVRRNSPPVAAGGPTPTPGRPPGTRTDDVIDVVTTKVPDEPAKR